MPLPGDELVQNPASMAVSSRADGTFVIDLGDAMIGEIGVVRRYTPDIAPDTLTAVSMGRRSYYVQRGDTVLLAGMEDAQRRILYDLPEQWLRFPMAMGDSIGGYYNGTGRYCDDLFLRKFGTYTTRADAMGTIVLPQGDTLRHVLRLHTERYLSTVTVPIDTLSKDIPAFTADSIRLYMATDSTLLRETVCRYYAPGYRYPILETAQLSSGLRPAPSSARVAALYCPPETQVLQPQQAPRLLPGGDALAGAPGDGSSTAVAFTARQSADGQSVVVGCTPVRDAQVQALLAGAQGFVLRTASQTVRAGDPCALTLGCAGLRPGQYIVYLEVDGERQSQKVSIR